MPGLHSILVLSAGTLMAIGLYAPWLYPATILGIGWYVFLLARAPSFGYAAWYGLLGWLAKALGAIAWFWYTYPLIWLETIAALTQISIIATYWLTAALWLALAGSVLGIAVKFLARFRSWLIIVVCLPVVWVGVEVLSSYVFSVFTQGEQSGPNIFFSFGYVGYALAEHATLFFLATLGGVYGLTWGIVFCTLLLSWHVTTCRRHKRYLSLGVVMTLLIVTSVWYPSSVLPTPPRESDLAIAVVETRFPAGSIDNAALRYHHTMVALEAVATHQPTHILLPEDHRFFSLSPDQLHTRDTLQQLFPQTYLLDSTSIETERGLTLRSVIYDTATDTFTYVDKQYLVPQGEYTPRLYRAGLALVGQADLIDQIMRTAAYVPGPIVNQTHLSPTIPSVLFCFESVSPLGVRTIVGEREELPPFVFHPISHTWFHQPTILWHKLDTMLRVQATWNGIPIVSAANNARSAIYAADGTINNVADLKPMYTSPTIAVYLFSL